MGAIERITVTLPAEMAASVRDTVADGEYASASEVIREALRDWMRARDQKRRELEGLREMIRVGDESGPGLPAEEVYAELSQMVANIRAKKSSSRSSTRGSRSRACARSRGSSPRMTPIAP